MKRLIKFHTSYDDGVETEQYMIVSDVPGETRILNLKISEDLSLFKRMKSELTDREIHTIDEK